MKVHGTVVETGELLGRHRLRCLKSISQILHEVIAFLDLLLAADFLQRFGGLGQHSHPLARGRQQLRRKVPTRDVERGGMLSLALDTRLVVCGRGR